MPTMPAATTMTTMVVLGGIEAAAAAMTLPFPGGGYAVAVSIPQIDVCLLVCYGNLCHLDSVYGPLQGLPTGGTKIPVRRLNGLNATLLYWESRFYAMVLPC
jgi:hypothetical protein